MVFVPRLPALRCILASIYPLNDVPSGFSEAINPPFNQRKNVLYKQKRELYGGALLRPPPATGGSHLRIRSPRLLAVGSDTGRESKSPNLPLTSFII